MSGLDCGEWEQRFISHYKDYRLQDRQGAWRTLSEFIDIAAAYPQQTSAVVRQLDFWQGLYEGLDDMLEEVLDGKRKQLEEQAAYLEGWLETMKSASQKRRDWIIKLEMILAVQRLQEHPLVRLRDQTEESANRLEAIEAQIFELEGQTDQLIAQIEDQLG